MSARKHKLKLAGTRLAKKCDGGITEPLLSTVMNYLAHDLLGIFGAVQAHENLANHLLLIFGKELRKPERRAAQSRCVSIRSSAAFASRQQLAYYRQED